MASTHTRNGLAVRKKNETTICFELNLFYMFVHFYKGLSVPKCSPQNVDIWMNFKYFSLRRKMFYLKELYQLRANNQIPWNWLLISLQIFVSFDMELYEIIYCGSCLRIFFVSNRTKYNLIFILCHHQNFYKINEYIFASCHWQFSSSLEFSLFSGLPFIAKWELI